MDLIIFNGKVLTMQAGSPRAQAVAIKGGRIMAVGRQEDILALGNQRTRLIDAGGKSVLPGFNDSHLHLYGYAQNKGGIDLGGLLGIAALQDRLRAHIKAQKPAPGAWITGRGWDQTDFKEGRMPTRHDLDPVSEGHPLVLKRKCGHVSVLNTQALKEAGIFEHPPQVPGGMIELGEDGRPTGILKENAMDLAQGQAGGPGARGSKALIAQAAADFVAAGLTSVQTDDLGAFGREPEALFSAYQEMAAAGQLPLRVNAQLLITDKEALRDLITRGCTTGFGDEWFKVGPLKILADGSFGGRSAWLRAPYADEPGTRGILLHTKEELRQLIRIAHEGGMQIAAHAIGDGAMDLVLALFEEAQRARPLKDPRFRIVHASLAAPDLLDRMRALGAAADVQPAFIPSDLPFINSRLGSKRAAWAYPFKDFLDRGIPLAGGSDCPVEDYRPLSGIHHAVCRQDHDGRPPEGWLPEQKLTLHEALHLYTLGAAYNAFEENLKGSLVPGKLADLVLLSGDIEATPKEAIKELTVEQTIVGGQTVYAS